MCSSTSLIAALTATATGVGVAIGLIVAAAIANGWFWTAPASVGLMIGAGAATTAAVASLALAQVLMSRFFTCLVSLPRTTPSLGCSAELRSFRIASAASLGILMAQAASCFSAAAGAWVPVAGTGPMAVIMATLILQLPAIPIMILNVNNLWTCLMAP